MEWHLLSASFCQVLLLWVSSNEIPQFMLNTNSMYYQRNITREPAVVKVVKLIVILNHPQGGWAKQPHIKQIHKHQPCEDSWANRNSWVTVKLRCTRANDLKDTINTIQASLTPWQHHKPITSMHRCINSFKEKVPTKYWGHTVYSKYKPGTSKWTNTCLIMIIVSLSKLKVNC